MIKTLSIIIPSYNMEEYLDQCLSSLVVSRINDLEIIIVNDGSIDKTRELAEKWHEKFPNSIKVINKDNGNYGSCINWGIKEATGQYIKVLDADDSFEQQNLDEFICFLKQSVADVIISDYLIVDEIGNVSDVHSFHENGLDGDFDKCLPMLMKDTIEMHAITYKSEIFRRFEYHQTEGISYTDQEWMFMPMAQVNTIAVFPKTVYRYLIGRIGQTVNPAMAYKNVNQLIIVMEKILRDYVDNLQDRTSSHNKYMYGRIIKKLPSIYRILLLKSKGKERDRNLIAIDNYIFKFCPLLYQDLESQIIGFMPYHYIRNWRKCGHKGSILLSCWQFIINLVLRY